MWTPCTMAHFPSISLESSNQFRRKYSQSCHQTIEKTVKSPHELNPSGRTSRTYLRVKLLMFLLPRNYHVLGSVPFYESIIFMTHVRTTSTMMTPATTTIVCYRKMQVIHTSIPCLGSSDLLGNSQQLRNRYLPTLVATLNWLYATNHQHHLPPIWLANLLNLNCLDGVAWRGTTRRKLL